jgi:3-oxoacyl-[acyl-carrier protein] reductase
MTRRTQPPGLPVAISTNPAEVLDTVAGMTPLRRLGQPSDVADVVAFLVGPDGRWITGQNLRATGGLG